jgi:hypothetical protein
MMKIIKLIGQMIMVVMIVIGGLFIWVMWEATPPKVEATPEETKTSSARYACTEFLSDVLKDPSSAEWGMRSGNWYASWPAKTDGDSVTVHPKFRAKNGLGALTINNFVCQVEVSGGKVRLLSLREL